MRRSLLDPIQKICRYYFKKPSSNCRILNHGKTIHTGCRRCLVDEEGRLGWGHVSSHVGVYVLSVSCLCGYERYLFGGFRKILSDQHGDVMVIVNTIPAPLMHISLTLQLNAALKMSASKGSKGRSSPILYRSIKPKSFSECSRAARLAQRMLSHPYCHSSNSN